MNLIITNGFEANFTVGLLRGLAANSVSFLALSCDDTEAKLNAIGIANVNVRGSLSEHRSAWRKSLNLLRYYARTLQLLSRYRGSTVHFTGILDRRRILVEAIFLHLCARLAARRYIYTVHNVLPHGAESSRFLRWFYRIAYRIPHILVVHTERVRRQLSDEFGVPCEKVRLSSLGLNEEMPLSSLTPAEARGRLGFRTGERLVLFFGRIDEYKGVDVLIEAFDRLRTPETRLIIAGPFGDSEFSQRVIKKLSAARRLVDIHLHERFIPNQEVEVYFKASDVLCLPYRNIYQSGLIFLGPRFGIPIVSTDVGSLRTFVEDGFGIVAKSNDAVGVANALDEFFATQNQFDRETIIANSARFRWDVICKGLVDLYDRQSESSPDRESDLIGPSEEWARGSGRVA